MINLIIFVFKYLMIYLIFILVDILLYLMNTFTMKDILEILQAAQPVLLIVKQLLEIRRDYKRWRMEQRKR